MRRAQDGDQMQRYCGRRHRWRSPRVQLTDSRRRHCRCRPLFLKSLGPLNGPKIVKGEKSMKAQNRVLVRQGARDLNDQEVAMVAGGLRTLTACTLAAAGTLDGDTFHSECGSPDQ